MNKKHEQKALRLIKKYRQKLCLNNWSIDLKLKTTPSESVGECTVDGMYLRAYISLWPTAFSKEENLEHIIKHEMCHILTAETRLIAYDLLNAKLRTHNEIDLANERLTETIARLVK